MKVNLRATVCGNDFETRNLTNKVNKKILYIVRLCKTQNDAHFMRVWDTSRIDIDERDLSPRRTTRH